MNLTIVTRHTHSFISWLYFGMTAHIGWDGKGVTNTIGAASLVYDFKARRMHVYHDRDSTRDMGS
jgi:hypothetical protein